MKLNLITFLLSLVEAQVNTNPYNRPSSMVGDFEQRWETVGGSKVGDEQFEFSDIGATASEDINGFCEDQAEAFDRECHQFARSTGSGTPRYGDYTDGVNSDGTQCNAWQTDVEKSYCLGQDCMFDYCLFVRDKYVQDCLALAADWVQAVDNSNKPCRNNRTDSNGKCWRLRTRNDKVTVTAPDGSSGDFFRFQDARSGLLPRPNFGTEVYNFGNMEDE